jgi:hypothetical protein
MNQEELHDSVRVKKEQILNPNKQQSSDDYSILSEET